MQMFQFLVKSLVEQVDGAVGKTGIMGPVNLLAVVANQASGRVVEREGTAAVYCGTTV